MLGLDEEPKFENEIIAITGSIPNIRAVLGHILASWGVGIDPNTITASLRAVLNAFERHDAQHGTNRTSK